MITVKKVSGVHFKSLEISVCEISAVIVIILELRARGVAQRRVKFVQVVPRIRVYVLGFMFYVFYVLCFRCFMF